MNEDGELRIRMRKAMANEFRAVARAQKCEDAAGTMWFLLWMYRQWAEDGLAQSGPKLAQSGPKLAQSGPKLAQSGPANFDLPNVSKSTTSLLLPCDSLNPKPSTSSISPEPEFFAAPKEPEPPSPLIFLPSNKTGVEVAISHTQADEFAALYPAVDVGQALNEMRAWLIANPSQRKTKTGMLRFVNGWLSKAQNRGTNGHDRKQTAHDRFLAGGLLALEKFKS